jgi:hypothetical protein
LACLLLQSIEANNEMDLTPSLISTVYGRHPARVLSFDGLYAGLAAAVRDQNVVVSREQGLEQYMYTNGCRFENRWDSFSLMARGLILDPAARRVVATPFPKFFNFGEVIPTLPDEPFEVTEKIDGSLGIVFHHGGRWQVATKGRLSSEQALWATSRLNEHCATASLCRGRRTWSRSSIREIGSSSHTILRRSSCSAVLMRKGTSFPGIPWKNWRRSRV